MLAMIISASATHIYAIRPFCFAADKCFVDFSCTNSTTNKPHTNVSKPTYLISIFQK